MNWCEIGGRAWNVTITEIEENYNILYTEVTGRVLAPGAPLTLDPLGTFYGHKVTFQRKRGHEAEFDLLFEFLSRPRTEGFPVKIVHGQTTIEYLAYSSNGTRKIKVIDDKKGRVYWDKLEANFIPLKAQVMP